MKHCLQCGKRYAEFAKFCTQDGTLLPTVSAGVVETRDKVMGDVRACPKCGKQYLGLARFCVRDGTPLPTLIDPLVGTRIKGKYHILDRIGKGGMGVVYKARHMTFGDLRALKLLDRQHSSDVTITTRFEQEARIAYKLNHPNAVRILDYEYTADPSSDALPLIVMEFVEGRSLRRLIKEDGALALGRAIHLIYHVAAALQAAHELGMVHGDIKPDNILVTSDAGGKEAAKVLDFGSATLQEPEGAPIMVTVKPGVVVGTPAYMSPEQIIGLTGSQLDGRSDLYALGIVMYEMLTGDVPFHGETPMHIMMKHLQQEPLPPQQFRPDRSIPPEIEAIIMKALAKEREHRYRTAKDLIVDLKLAHAPRERQ